MTSRQTVFVVIEETGNSAVVDGFFVVGVFADEAAAHAKAQAWANGPAGRHSSVTVHAEEVQR